MTVDQMVELLDQYADDVESAKHVEPENRKYHKKEDLDVFLLLAKLAPDTNNLIAGADHDVIYFSTDVEELARVATKKDLLNLVIAGVFYDSDADCMSMFV